jgi:hypothetical protein
MLETIAFKAVARVKRRHKMKRLILGLVFLALSNQAYSDTAWIKNTSIKQVLNQSNTYGGCMLFLDTAIAEIGLACPGRWVALSCDGTFNNRDVAARMYDLAIVAIALDKKVSVEVDDTKKHNGYCVVKRMDLKN